MYNLTYGIYEGVLIVFTGTYSNKKYYLYLGIEENTV